MEDEHRPGLLLPTLKTDHIDLESAPSGNHGEHLMGSAGRRSL